MRCGHLKYRIDIYHQHDNIPRIVMKADRVY